MNNLVPNKEALLKWVEALESGKYKQTAGSLKKIVNGKASHCCLGVACELFMKKQLARAKWQNSTDGRSARCYIAWNPARDPQETYTEGDELPTELRQWMGLSIGEQTDIIEANDGQKLTFEEIAETVRLVYDL